VVFRITGRATPIPGGSETVSVRMVVQRVDWLALELVVTSMRAEPRLRVDARPRLLSIDIEGATARVAKLTVAPGAAVSEVNHPGIAGGSIR
jgi:hypothetical protein